MNKLRVFSSALIFLFAASFSYAQDKKISNGQVSQQEKTNTTNQVDFGDDPGKIYINSAAINVFEGKVLNDSLINQLLNVEKKIKLTKYLEPKDGIMQYGKLGMNGVIIYRTK